MTKEEFRKAFVAEMLSAAGPAFADGTSVADYAEQAWEGYWDDETFMRMEGEGPEACAREDISEWEVV